MRKANVFLLLALSVLICAGCGKNGGNGGKSDAGDNVGVPVEEAGVAKATTMYLEKTEGMVMVSDEGGTEQEPREKLPLFSGYGIKTLEASFGWFNLDDTKLVKMDEKSAASIQKEDKHLVLSAEDGTLYFNVTEPLKEDESLDIRTSSMSVGIRGTCGWVDAEDETLYLLEGTVTCASMETGENVEVTAGQYARLSKEDGGFEIGEFKRNDVPNFVREEADDNVLGALAEAWPEEGSLVYTLPMTFDELNTVMQSVSGTDTVVVIKAGDGENTLWYDNYGTVDCHLVVDRDVDLVIPEEGGLLISGTMEVRGNIENAGQILVDEDGTLRVEGKFDNLGLLNNGWIEKAINEMDGTVGRQNSRLIAERGITSTGSLGNLGVIEGDLIINGGTLLLYNGEVEQVILNDGTLMERDGTYGSLVQNGGSVE